MKVVKKAQFIEEELLVDQAEKEKVQQAQDAKDRAEQSQNWKDQAEQSQNWKDQAEQSHDRKDQANHGEFTQKLVEISKPLNGTENPSGVSLPQCSKALELRKAEENINRAHDKLQQRELPQLEVKEAQKRNFDARKCIGNEQSAFVQAIPRAKQSVNLNPLYEQLKLCMCPSE